MFDINALLMAYGFGVVLGVVGALIFLRRPANRSKSLTYNPPRKEYPFEWRAEFNPCRKETRAFVKYPGGDWTEIEIEPWPRSHIRGWGEAAARFEVRLALQEEERRHKESLQVDEWVEFGPYAITRPEKEA